MIRCLWYAIVVLALLGCSNPVEPTRDVDAQIEEPACNLVPDLPGCP